MRRWLRSGELPALDGWDLWRLREVGAWGDVGRILGMRWEAMGGQALLERLGDCVVPLWRDRALGRWLGTLGIPNPDAVLVETDDAGGTVLRPVDLKWSLDTADHGQIAGDTLARLVERGGERLRTLLPGAADRRRFGDGLFVAPDRPLNRLFLRSRVNATRARSIAPRDVLWISVDPAAFYAPLPGWASARRLAALEGLGDPASHLEIADRYYHLGVGVRGALAAQARSLFDERDGSSDEQLMMIEPVLEDRIGRRLDDLIDSIGARSARDLVRRLGGTHVERQQLRAQLRGLERPWYRFGDLLADAARLGLRRDEGGETETAVLRDVYRDLVRAHAADVRARGRELSAEGLDNQTALDRIRSEEKLFKRRARERAREALLRREEHCVSGAADGEGDLP